MPDYTSSQRKQLRGLAHKLEPLVRVGTQGLTEALVKATVAALDDHELIKVKFVDSKDEKDEISQSLAERAGACLAGRIGNIAILYREHPDPKKRKIEID